MIDAKILLVAKDAGAIPIHVVGKGDPMPSHVHAWAAAYGFDCTPLSLLLVPHRDQKISDVYVGAPSDSDDPFALGAISARLPEGTYQFSGEIRNAESVALSWLTELYKYDPHRETRVRQTRLVVPRGVDRARVVRLANAVFLVRDMVNAPANVFGPDELEAEARKVAASHGARLRVIAGATLEREFPLIHTVGMASPRRPRLIDLTWGNPKHPKVSLVGKGVVFDTGGLDIKPSAAMLLMKKDMGGAASVLGLASLIMSAKLKVRLRVLLPAVENAISGNAFRPGDVFKTRKGLTVEIGNTDAEGRLILCDALALADEEKPELIVDMATLTGAARVALGPDLPAFFTDDDGLADALMRAGLAVNDPVWRLPLWRAYTQMIDTPIADLNNSGGSFAGAITAALFLRRFVENAKAYVHLDIMAWTPSAKPGRPKGGEAQAMRAVFAVLEKRFGR